jgi:beta-N-acetylhexosaminidase
MAGQLLMLGFRGTTLSADNPIVADIRDRHLGGVVLFSYDLPSDNPVRNIESPEQVRALCTALQEAADGRLLVAVDEEGGKVARLGPDHGFPATRSAAELGATGAPAVTRAASEAVASTLAGLGFNLNFAPVVDVNTNPQNPVIGQLDRSFSSDPGVVAGHAAAWVEGHRAHGVLTCLKHFPGHGSSRADSHAGFVDVTDTWDPLELIPYRELVGRGLADAVMVAHVFNANWDAEHPASLSPNVIEGMLREEIGFAGPVISDDLGMGAITEKYDLEASIRLALLAGNDLLVFGNNIGAFDPDLGRRAHQAILDLVARGDVPAERLAASYQRLTALKHALAAP